MTESTMFWSDDENSEHMKVPEDVVDVLFAIECRQIPVDHAHPLSEGLQGLAPWLASESRTAIHSIHVAGSQNGWERPEHGTESVIMVSRRTKLALRCPQHRVDELLTTLEGAELDLRGNRLRIGAGKARPLSLETTIFARYVVVDPDRIEEAAFLGAMAGLLREKGIHIKKALCGKTQPLATPTGPLLTRSLLLAGLTPEESIRLQQVGLGSHGLLGCGIFIPHKGIDAVHKA